MKIAVIGASGKSGSVITKEALARGYKVTGIVRMLQRMYPRRLKNDKRYFGPYLRRSEGL